MNSPADGCPPAVENGRFRKGVQATVSRSSRENEQERLHGHRAIARRPLGQPKARRRLQARAPERSSAAPGKAPTFCGAYFTERASKQVAPSTMRRSSTPSAVAQTVCVSTSSVHDQSVQGNPATTASAPRLRTAPGSGSDGRRGAPSSLRKVRLAASAALPRAPRDRKSCVDRPGRRRVRDARRPASARARGSRAAAAGSRRK